MVESIVIVPGTKALKEIRLQFRGVIQNFNPEGEHAQQFFTNKDETIIGLNIKQATKQNDVYLLLRDLQGDIKILSNVNERVVKLFPDKDPSIDIGFIYVQSINGNICKMGTIVYRANNPTVTSFLISVDVDGKLRRVSEQ